MLMLRRALALSRLLPDCCFFAAAAVLYNSNFLRKLDRGKGDDGAQGRLCPWT